MTTEEINSALLEKAQAEQEKYREQLLNLSPEEILNNASKFAAYNEILAALKFRDLEDEQAEILLKSNTPLADIYNDFQGGSLGFMPDLSESIGEFANELIEKEAAKREALRNLPVYPYSFDYALENREIDQYHESRKANIACRDAIDAAIGEHFRENSLDGKAAVAEVSDVFGYERLLFVCASTVRQKESDGRISRDNIQWAYTLPVYADNDSYGHNRRIEYLVDKSHPGVFNMFVKTARREYLLTQPLTVPEIRAEAQRLIDRLKAPTEPNSPNGTHFMAEISPDFLARASSRDTTALQKFLPFKSLALTTMKDRKGVFAVIAGDENRDKKLREPRASVLAKLQEPAPKEKTAPNNSAKSRDAEL